MAEIHAFELVSSSVPYQASKLVFVIIFALISRTTNDAACYGPDSSIDSREKVGNVSPSRFYCTTVSSRSSRVTPRMAFYQRSAYRNSNAQLLLFRPGLCGLLLLI